jgi:hypothetical protein
MEGSKAGIPILAKRIAEGSYKELDKYGVLNDDYRHVISTKTKNGESFYNEKTGKWELNEADKQRLLTEKDKREQIRKNREAKKNQNNSTDQAKPVVPTDAENKPIDTTNQAKPFSIEDILNNIGIKPTLNKETGELEVILKDGIKAH